MMIKALDTIAEQEAWSRQATLTKPQGSLGRLEHIACWFAARQGCAIPNVLQPHITIFAADHGVSAEGVSAFPAVVTSEMIKNFARGGAAINVLAKQSKASLSVVDVGVQYDVSDVEGIVHAKVSEGTENLLHQAAMTTDQCRQAMQVGRKQAMQAIEQGCNVLIAGDMGIANTTASACLICLFTGRTAAEVVGRGTGIDDAAYQLKIKVVEQAIQRVALAQVKPEHYLHELGGLEIAAMCGFYLEAAVQGVPIMIDGFISAAAALAAQCLEAEVHAWMLASHVSQESGHIFALNQLGLAPLIDFKLRLGEGSGAALVLPLLQSAVALHREMATFDSAGISSQ
ncbi:MAG: nicotinate-nucleotide--dimethylbenzimidazole phosphoribosyltransferase [Ghiorsea sp.]